MDVENRTQTQKWKSPGRFLSSMFHLSKAESHPSRLSGIIPYHVIIT